MAEIFKVNKNKLYSSPSGSSVSLTPTYGQSTIDNPGPGVGINNGASLTPSTYKVAMGDTLSAIAAKLGVPMANITGYKSGDPNIISPGETLNVMVGGSNPTPTPTKTNLPASSGDQPPVKTPLDDITSLDAYKGVMAGVDTAQTNYDTAASGYKTKLATPINSTDIFKDQSTKQGVETKSQAVLDAETLLNSRRAEWEKNILSLESQPGVLMPVIAGQQANQLKLANIDLARLEADVEAKKGNYQNAYNLAKFATELEVQTKQNELVNAEKTYSLAESQLTKAQQKKVEFVTNYLKQTQPDLEIKTETNDSGDMTILGIDPKTGNVKYQKVFKGIATTKKTTAPSINDLPEDQQIFVNKVQNAINVGDTTYDDAVTNFPVVAKYLKPKSGGY